MLKVTKKMSREEVAKMSLQVLTFRDEINIMMNTNCKHQTSLHSVMRNRSKSRSTAAAAVVVVVVGPFGS